MRLRLKADVDLRHCYTLSEMFMCVGDRRQSVSAMNLGVDTIHPDFALSAVWSRSRVYAEYQLTSIETAWSQAVPAKERVQELLEQERT